MVGYIPTYGLLLRVSRSYFYEVTEARVDDKFDFNVLFFKLTDAQEEIGRRF